MFNINTKVYKILFANSLPAHISPYGFKPGVFIRIVKLFRPKGEYHIHNTTVIIYAFNKKVTLNPGCIMDFQQNSGQ